MMVPWFVHQCCVIPRKTDPSVLSAEKITSIHSSVEVNVSLHGFHPSTKIELLNQPQHEQCVYLGHDQSSFFFPIFS